MINLDREVFFLLFFLFSLQNFFLGCVLILKRYRNTERLYLGGTFVTIYCIISACIESTLYLGL